MADVASRDLAVADVLRGRTVSISVGDGTDKKLTIDNLAFDSTIETMQENINILQTELEDLSTLKQEISRDMEVVMVL